MKWVIAVLVLSAVLASVCGADTSRDRREAQGSGSCSPGTTWKQDCNDCRCSPNGQPICTYKLCLGKRDVSGQAEEPAPRE
ncbi:hypothetical protein ONE63_003914 [Megalurothrips usitatus]|uniref:Pacifastin domain-containing protein n=1 Tax=Megalurothrips usitatus TaxID=439358 RepID=A0AAV7X8S7_9NEOP|nr:hypothetical protein ONE63_003914 [Megalurothrips usitatus]